MPEQRTTKQLIAIQDALKGAEGPLTIEEIHSAASTQVRTLGLRTVYRVVRRLQERGEIVNIPVPGGSDRYETAAVAAKHHHHFHCTTCDRFFDIKGCVGGLEALLPEGFRLEHHDLTLSGRCPACA
ncbi:MAG: transcriptional repressor [Phycisphaerales bacterium]|nr:transcriptional repressor [Phycisphaerales bacterium]